MASRAITWTLAIIAAVVVTLPLLSLLSTARGGGLMDAGGMTGENMRAVVGMIWWLLAAAFVIASIVVLVRSVTRV